jgi:hypothetical protein
LGALIPDFFSERGPTSLSKLSGRQNLVPY